MNIERALQESMPAVDEKTGITFGKNQMLRDRHQIVIVGGGAGGLELATKLGKKYGKRKSADVTLIDANLTHIWKPLLHEVASGKRNPGEDEVNYLAQARWNHFTFRLGRLESLDRENQIVTMAPIEDEEGKPFIPRRSFYYDTLVIAIGSQTNSFGTPGVEEYGAFLDSRQTGGQVPSTAAPIFFAHAHA